jgi:putative spermidine/putrescine transport system permease protein
MLLDFEKLGALRWALAALCVAVCLFLTLPIVFIVLLSFGSSRWLAFPPPDWTLKWYIEFFSNKQWIASILTSAQIAAVVSVLSLVIGLLASFAVVRGNFRGRGLLRSFLITPVVLPVVVLAVGLYALFLRIGLSGTFIGLVIAHLVIALPFSIIVISNSLASFDKSIEDAAVLCGASPLKAKLQVTLPSIRISLFGAALFSFLASWDEVVLAIFMSSARLQTFPVRIWTTLRQDLTPVIAAASTLLVAITIVILLITALSAKRWTK